MFKGNILTSARLEQGRYFSPVNGELQFYFYFLTLSFLLSWVFLCGHETLCDKVEVISKERVINIPGLVGTVVRFPDLEPFVSIQ